MGLDVYEHAYYIDFGVARASYIDAFFKNLEWSAVGENLDRARSGKVYARVKVEAIAQLVERAVPRRDRPAPPG